MIFYVSQLKEPFHGRQIGPFIYILVQYKNDLGLLKHEKVHTRQWWTRGLFIHSLFYKFHHNYRYRCELQAYRKQLKYSYHPKYYAKFISERYNLDVSYDKALEDLTK